MILCRKCGHQNADDESFCAQCNSYLEWSGDKVGIATPSAPASPLLPAPAAAPPSQQRLRRLRHGAATAPPPPSAPATVQPISPTPPLPSPRASVAPTGCPTTDRCRATGPQAGRRCRRSASRAPAVRRRAGRRATPTTAAAASGGAGLQARRSHLPELRCRQRPGPQVLPEVRQQPGARGGRRAGAGALVSEALPAKRHGPPGGRPAAVHGRPRHARCHHSWAGCCPSRSWWSSWVPSAATS